MKLLFTLSLLLLFFKFSIAQCDINQDEYIVQIQPDNFPQETTWDFKDVNGNIITSGNVNGDTVCMPKNTCITFTIYDTYGDGICCNYGNGFYKLLSNGNLIDSGGSFAFSNSLSINCPNGYSCSDPIIADTGSFQITTFPTWLKFKASQIGMYRFTTCFPQNNCNTVVSAYENCTNANSQSLAGALFHDDDGDCGQLAVASAGLDTNTWIIVKINTVANSCIGDTVKFAIIYDGPVRGCTDPNACNYNPLATVSDTCYYYPSPQCPSGPDLVLDQLAFETSLQLSTETGDNCAVAEGCLTGIGNRTVIRFDTKIDNIGESDYYIGNPNANPDQFSFTNCHGHAHYEGYAEYSLFDMSGNKIPIGFKSGFCVIDLSCPPNIPAKYTCGNMGITAGCSDIYSSGLTCQYIDITDVDTGAYRFATMVNWDRSPDALGKYENEYTNNIAQVCIRIYLDQFGAKNFEIIDNCDLYVDCAGDTNGNALVDCKGVCNGSAQFGDIDTNTVANFNDVNNYIPGILDSTIEVNTCNDLNNDGLITVWDAALLFDCKKNGSPQSNSCKFPRGVTIPSPSVLLKMDGINTVQQYVDVAIYNTTEVKAYQFRIKGLKIIGVESLIDPLDYPDAPQFKVDKDIIICNSISDSSISKSLGFKKLVRIYYSTVTGNEICVYKIDNIINKTIQALNPVISGSCINSSGLVGLENPLKGAAFSLNPNPGNGTFNFNLFSDAATEVDLNIYDVMGKVIYTKHFETTLHINKTIELDVAKGVYFVYVKHQWGTKMERLVIE